MSCATTTIKYTVFIFNTIIAVLGLGAVIITSLALKKITYEERAACITLIVLSSIVFLISFFGCFGAIRENIYLTWIYAIVMLLLLIGNIVIMFTALKKFDGEKRAREIIDDAWAKELIGTDDLATWQSMLDCCGKQSPQDYTNANLTIPASCYAGSNSSNPANLYKDGCLAKLTDLLENVEHVLNTISWSIIGVEAVAFICACVLAITFTNQQRRARY